MRFQQRGILILIDSDEPEYMLICADWSEPLLVTHTTLLEIACRGSYVLN